MLARANYRRTSEKMFGTLSRQARTISEQFFLEFLAQLLFDALFYFLIYNRLSAYILNLAF